MQISQRYKVGDKMARKSKPKFVEPYHVETWFERDRAHVDLQDANDETIIEWWDEDVEQAIEDGFLDPRDYYGSAVQYAEEMGLL